METKLGKVTLEKKRKRRDWSDRKVATLKCDAACITQTGKILLLSVVASESVLKALRAELVSNADALEIDIDLPSVYGEDGAVITQGLSRCNCEAWSEGYVFKRAKLIDGLWHGILIAKAKGFMPALTEEALWQELRSERYTTPVLREWMPWLLKELTKDGLAKLQASGCTPGLLVLCNEGLDELVSAGLKKRALRIPRE